MRDEEGHKKGPEEREEGLSFGSSDVFERGAATHPAFVLWGATSRRLFHAPGTAAGIRNSGTQIPG
jgi:hypothetical protein